MTSITVTTNGQLKNAISELEANGGGTIKLVNNGETYNLTGSNFGTADGVITITSADPDDQAVMDGVRVLDSQNLAFENLTFDSTSVSRDNWINDLMVERSENISVTDSTFISKADGTFMTGGEGVARGEDMGLVRDTEGFTFEGNVVTNYFHGIMFVDSNDLNVNDNEFGMLQGDGIRGGGIQDAEFKGNWFHDWYGSSTKANHDDMFQIWGSGVDQLSKNILISDNFFDAGGGLATQTILIQNEEWKSEEDNYSNIVIANNVIYNGHTHGITVDDTVGVQVLDNTVLYNPQANFADSNPSGPPSIRVQNSDGAVVEGNIASEVYVGGKAETQDNVWINYGSPSHPNYYEDHIVNISSGGKIDLRDLEVREDSPWFENFGADTDQHDGAHPAVTAVMTHTAVPGQHGTFILDAGLSHTPTGPLSADDAVFEWHFADGTVIKSQTVEVSFNGHGINEVELIVKTSQGDQDAITRDVDVKNSVIREIDFNDEPGNSPGITFVDFSEDNIVEGLNGNGFLLDGNSEVHINKKISDLHEMDQFTIDVTLQKVAADDSGKVMDFHGSMSLNVRDDGSLRFGMKTEDGNFAVDTGDIAISDTEWHKITVVYNSHFEELSLWLDGNKLGETHATGKTLPYNHWGPQLGNPDFKGESINAVIDDFAFYRDGLNDFEVQQNHVEALSLEDIDLDTIYPPKEGYSASGNSYRSLDTEEAEDIASTLLEQISTEPAQDDTAPEQVIDETPSPQEAPEVEETGEEKFAPVVEQTPPPTDEEASVIEDTKELIGKEKVLISGNDKFSALIAMCFPPEDLDQVRMLASQNTSDAQTQATDDDFVFLSKVFNTMKSWGPSTDTEEPQEDIATTAFQSLNMSIKLEDIPSYPAHQEQYMDELEKDAEQDNYTDELFW